MMRALVLLAEGFEEIEAITVVDVLRRADVEVDMCSIHESKSVKGAHGVRVEADITLRELGDAARYDALVTPGGLPCALHLRDSDAVADMIRAFYRQEGKTIGCICASPVVLAKAGVAGEIAGVCYPSFEDQVGFKEYRRQAVVVDRNVVTSMGPGTAFCFALALAERLAGKDVAEKVRNDAMVAYAK